MTFAIFVFKPFVIAGPGHFQNTTLNIYWIFSVVSLYKGILYGRAFAKYAVAFLGFRSPSQAVLAVFLIQHFPEHEICLLFAGAGFLCF